MKSRRLLLPLLALCAVALSPSLALAKDPVGTGIDPSPSGPYTYTHEDLGFTPQYAQAKEQWFLARMTGGSLAAAASLGIDLPLDPAPPTNWVLAFTIYHQKTNSWCLVATAESIAHWSFGGYNSPSVLAVQRDTIVPGIGTPLDGINTQAWVNRQYTNHGSSWRYVDYTSSTETYFKGHIMSDLYDANMPMYVRVNLGSGYYAWKGSTALHATTATGYTSSGTYVRTSDPFAHVSSGKCTSAWDYGAANLGCTWGNPNMNGNYTMHYYWLARDINRYRDTGEIIRPEWY